MIRETVNLSTKQETDSTLMNRIELDINALSGPARDNLLAWAERWQCTPGEAAVRLLDAAAKKRKPRNPQPEQAAAA